MPEKRKSERLKSREVKSSLKSMKPELPIVVAVAVPLLAAVAVPTHPVLPAPPASNPDPPAAASAEAAEGTLLFNAIRTTARNVRCGLGAGPSTVTKSRECCSRCQVLVAANCCVICDRMLRDHITDPSLHDHMFSPSAHFDTNSRRIVCSKPSCVRESGRVVRGLAAIEPVLESLIGTVIKTSTNHLSASWYPREAVRGAGVRGGVSAARGYAVLGTSPPVKPAYFVFAPSAEEVHAMTGVAYDPRVWPTDFPAIHKLMRLLRMILEALPKECTVVQGKVSASSGGSTSSTSSSGSGGGGKHKGGTGSDGSASGTMRREDVVKTIWTSMSNAFVNSTSKSQSMNRELPRLAERFPDITTSSKTPNAHALIGDAFSVFLMLHIGSAGVLKSMDEDASVGASSSEPATEREAILLSILQEKLNKLARNTSTCNNATCKGMPVPPLFVHDPPVNVSELTGSAELQQYIAANPATMLVPVHKTGSANLHCFVANPHVPASVNLQGVADRMNALLHEIVVLQELLVEMLCFPTGDTVRAPFEDGDTDVTKEEMSLLEFGDNFDFVSGSEWC